MGGGFEVEVGVESKPALLRRAQTARTLKIAGCGTRRTSGGGPYEDMSNPRGRGEPLPYKWGDLETGLGVGTPEEGSPVIRRALRLKVR